MKKIALLLICMCLSSCSVNRPDHVPIYVNVCKEYGSALEKSERGLTHTNSRVGKNGELYFALEKEGNYTVDEARAILITEVEELLKLFTGTEG